MKNFLFATAFAAFAVGCAPDPSSQSKGIATDLDADQSTTTEETYLYWVEDNQISRGVCESEHGFVTRSACASEVESMEYETFKIRLNDGLSEHIGDLESQISSLTTMIDVVSEQIAVTRAELADVEADADITEAELEAAREEMVYLEDIVFEYRAQIALIEAQLAIAKASDLEQMAEMIAADLERARVVLATIYSAVADYSERLQALLVYAQSLRDQLVPLIDQLDLLTLDLETAERDLNESRALFAIYEDTIGKLESDINWFITSEHDDLFTANRQYVKMFHRIFSEAASE